jgi:hypothetical protein
MNTEFGRSLNGNRSGTDHGWAGGWFVAGGAVRGGRVYGRIPVIDPLGPDFHTRNNPTQIPAVAPEQIGATVARWFGVPETDVAQIFPRLAEFPQRDLGFLGGGAAGLVSASRAAAAAAAEPAAAAAGDQGGSCGAGGGLAAAAIAGLLALGGGRRS